MRKIIILMLCCLTMPVIAQNGYDAEPGTPADNWCYPGGEWGDGRCNHPDPFVQTYNWTIGWYMPRCEAQIFPADALPEPCIVEDAPPLPRTNNNADLDDDDDPPVVDNDLDGDGMDDNWEINFFNDLSRSGPEDDDADGLTTLGEFLARTDPLINDTDNDALLDGYEVAVTNTDPTDADTDDDGLLDGEELAGPTFTNPRIADTDNDGLDDGVEIGGFTITINGVVFANIMTDPNVRDTDSDGLLDGDEVNVIGTHPELWDTDGDGVSDNRDSCPIDAGTLPDGCP